MKKLTPFLILLLFLASCGGGGKESVENEEVQKPHEPEYLYGICIDSLDVVEGKVQKNEYMSTIMQNEGVGYSTINYIDRNHRSVFEAKKIKEGHKYVFLKTRDSVPQAKYWIYEIDRINYAVFELCDSLKAWRGEKEVTSQVEHVGVEIKSSLWNALTAVGCDPNLIMELSDIYAWTIDFFGIQEGDSCKVVFEKKYIMGDSVPYSTGNVMAAYFKNGGVGHYAFCFEQDGKKEYFDEKGDNLRKAFLKAPLNYRRISSTFSEGRMHPVYHVMRPHHGVDYAAPTGTPVQAIADGTVIAKGWDKKGGGNYIKIKHNSTYTTTYMHLSKFDKSVVQGGKVKQGQTIGYVGSTGASTGPHLDFRLQQNGNYIDPLKFKSPSADPIKKENMERFKAGADSLMRILKEH